MTAAAVCGATKRDGSACTLTARPDGFCWAHSPELAGQRAEVRRKGGTNRATAIRASKHLPPHLQDAEQRLIRLCDDVERGRITARQAEVIGGLIGRLLDLARFAFETAAAAALEARITEIEGHLKEQSA